MEDALVATASVDSDKTSLGNPAGNAELEKSLRASQDNLAEYDYLHKLGHDSNTVKYSPNKV